MAMSLEDLLAEEGFKSSSSKRMNRVSSGPPATRIKPDRFQDEREFGVPAHVRKTERAYSDTRRYDKHDKSPVTDRFNVRRSLDVIKRERHRTQYSIDSSQQSPFSEIVEVKQGIRKVKNGAMEKGKYKDIYLNDTFSPPDILGRDVQIDNAYAGSSSSKSDKTRKKKENARDSRARRPVEMESVGEVALDDIAVKALISILSGYIKSFLKDQDFRTSMYHNCFAALNVSKLEEEIVAESKIVSNLEQAIETVEKAAENRATAKELKKASLQLSVITGLNANDLKDGFTSGFPNSILSACGHLYLSVIYQIQRKERISAKHLLQIFCDSPSIARTTLVPELWENVFYPHLSHLETWYNQQVDSLTDGPRNTRKLKQLKKVYYEILDSGTYQFAVYYKDWLSDGVEAPLMPSIPPPSVSVNAIHHEGANGSGSDFSSPSFASKSMVSKKLYDSVFGPTHKPVTPEVEDYQLSQRSDDDIYSFDESIVDKRTLTYEYEDSDAKSEREPIFKQEDLESPDMLQSLPSAKVNELTLKKLAKSVFGLQQTEKLDDEKYTDFSVKTKPLGEDGRYSFLNIPKDYVCPLTGLLFEDPVTIETGQTYERVAIVEWFNNGKKTCPVTGKNLECHIVPFTNSILKRIISDWKSNHSREILSSASQPTRSPGEYNSKAETTVFILEQLLTVFGRDENAANAKHLLALGGLKFLIQRFEHGNLNEKTCVAGLLSHCIKADSSCRNNVARLIQKQGLLELLHCEGVKSRANAVFLLFDLICLSRRKDVSLFLSGLNKESIVSSMHILLIFLQSCSLEQRPLVSVLLLHLDLMVDQQKYSVYRVEAVDTFTSSLDISLSNEKVRETCCRALNILGGRISFSGGVITEDWILKKAGFIDAKITIKNNILPDNDEEEEQVDDWLIQLSASLLGDGKTSFLDSLSRWLSSENREMTKVGLTTVVWFSSSVATLHDYESQLSAFSVLISKLKENLECSEWVEHKILAATSLLNFSKIPDCMNLLTTIADEIAPTLMNLSETCRTARELNALISQEDL